MAAVAWLLMTTSFISVTSFGILANRIAVSIGVNTHLLTVLGIDSFSMGLSAAFFLGQGGLFDNRLKTGLMIAQALLIAPQFLIPLIDNLWLIVIFRFFQGLIIMMLALFSIQLEGWFAPKERAKSLAFTLGAIKHRERIRRHPRYGFRIYPVAGILLRDRNCNVARCDYLFHFR